VVQGLTEFLPVSSTAHLLIGERLLGFSDPGSVFTEMIQLGSILAIVWLYRAKLWEVVSGLPTRSDSRRFALMIVIAFVPAVVAGLLAADYVESVLHQSPGVIAAAFIAGGLVMLGVERWVTPRRGGTVDDTTLGQAFGVGVIQTLALVPGVSRSGATIIGGLAMGLDRAAAAEFSFFLAMPTLAAAFVHSALELRQQLTADRLAEVGVGFVAAFAASLLVVKPFLGYVRRRGFAPFAWYRIAAGLLIAGAMAAGWFR
jgi:undecaprenyl-diphosphatase